MAKEYNIQDNNKYIHQLRWKYWFLKEHTKVTTWCNLNQNLKKKNEIKMCFHVEEIRMADTLFFDHSIFQLWQRITKIFEGQQCKNYIFNRKNWCLQRKGCFLQSSRSSKRSKEHYILFSQVSFRKQHIANMENFKSRKMIIITRQILPISGREDSLKLWLTN